MEENAGGIRPTTETPLKDQIIDALRAVGATGRNARTLNFVEISLFVNGVRAAHGLPMIWDGYFDAMDELVAAGKIYRNSECGRYSLVPDAMQNGDITPGLAAAIDGLARAVARLHVMNKNKSKGAQ